MLYERWRQIARQGGGRLALRDLASGQQWTFSELDHVAESSPLFAQSIVCPRGNSAGFVLEVLRAWRWGRVVCPLEPAQASPALESLPPRCVHLKTTSATTGQSRLVAFTGAQLAADADNIVATMGLRPDWPNLGAISMAHSYGFSNLVLPLLLHGIPLIIAPFPLPEALRRAAQGEPALTLAGVPALWRAWHEAGAIPPNLRLAISAGAHLPVALEQAVFASTGLKIHNFYGSSECGGIAYEAGPAPRVDDSCVGAPMRNVRLTLNEEGCLRVHGAAVGETYWPERSPALGDGAFQTGDFAELSDGLVFLRGRSSDQINVAGRKVSPETVELALRQHPAVRDCLVFSVPSRDADRAELIVVAIATAAPVVSDQLKQFLLAKLPAWQVPREWWWVDSLETNQRGKLSRAEWRRRFLESRAARSRA
jgi:long-chain acyl-CoA synthetase